MVAPLQGPSVNTFVRHPRFWMTIVAVLCILVGMLAVRIWDPPKSRSVPVSATGVPPAPPLSSDCRKCHEDIFQSWLESHHAHANAPLGRQHREAFAATSLPENAAVIFSPGKPNLRLRGTDGDQWFEAGMILAHDPLQQALVSWPDGGWQVTQIAWDVHQKEWFSVYADQRQPGEWGSWTGRGMNWNASCAFCHMTGFAKNYDPEKNRYASTWREQGVGCTQCHPSLLASAPADRTPFCAKLDKHRTLDNCASCHSRREDVDGRFQPGDLYADHFHLQLPTRAGLYYPDGQILDEVYVWTSFRLSSMGHSGVTCLDCHDPHTYQTILPVENNALCLRCHSSPGVEMTPGGLRSPVIEPEAHSHHQPGSTGNRCVECHMPHTTYMERDPRRDHGFLHPDPRLTLELQIPNACARCHEGQDANAKVYTTQEMVESAETWWGREMNATARRRARVLAQAYAGTLTDPQPMLELLRDTPPSESLRTANPYWQATCLELLSPWAGHPEVIHAAQALQTAEVPRLRAAAATLLATGPAGAASASDDPVRTVRRVIARMRPELLADYPRLEAEWHEEIRYSADQPTGALAMAHWYEAKKNPAKAQEWFQRALQYDPFSPGIPHAYAIFLSTHGRMAEALQALQDAIRLAPLEPLPHFHRALALVEMNRRAEGEEELRKTVGLAPGFARAHYNLGLLLAQDGKIREGVESLLNAVRADPNDPAYRYALATLYVQQGNVEAAYSILEDTVAIFPTHQPSQELLRLLQQ